MNTHYEIPVIDIFAGPGGLAEGFSRCQAHGRKVFRTALSVEKHPAAHRTLSLRAFYRQFISGEVPTAYFDRLSGKITTQELFARYPREAAVARHEAWLAELGSQSTPVQALRDRAAAALGKTSDWVLLGGPPCQAYSLAGRSRNRGIEGYRFEADHKTQLYLEYLQLIADFWPAVFVMENVKGLLSAQLDGNSMFARILDDLADPARAIAREGRSCRDLQRRHHYDLYPIVTARDGLEGFTSTRPADYVIRAEQYGIPQARHRVIIVGVRRDFSSRRPTLLMPHGKPVTVRDVIADLPRLRSGLSRNDSPERWGETIARLGRKTWQKNIAVNGRGNVAERVGEIAKQSTELSDLPLKQSKSRNRQRNAYGLQWYESNLMSFVTNHEARTHMPSDLLRYLFAACFAEVNERSPELRDFPKRLLPAHKNTGLAILGSHFADRFRVQLFDRPSTTVTSHIGKDGHYYIHPDPSQCRSLTVREAARLQTFPDTYFFEGNRTEQYVQVGNAVPPLLAHQIAAKVFELFRQ